MSRGSGATISRSLPVVGWGLDGQRQENRRLGRRLARAPEAVAGRPEGRPLPGSAELPRAARRRAGALPRLHFDHAVGQAQGVGVQRMAGEQRR
eukprot:scaffold42115_cov39-Phaeocystis_antarctica.AAC.1